MQETFESLLGSETRAKLLAALFAGHAQEWTLTALAQKANVDAGGAHRELAKFSEWGLVQTDEIGGQVRYHLNVEHPFYPGLHELLHALHATGKRLYLMEDMPVAYPQLMDYMDLRFSSPHLRKRGLRSTITRSLSVFKNGGALLYFDSDEFDNLSKEVVDRIFEDPKFGLEDTEEVLELTEELFETGEEMERVNYAAATNRQLAAYFRKYFDVFQRSHVTGWVHNMSDLRHMFFSKRLIELLKGKIDATGSKFKPGDAFSKLTTPLEASYMQREHDDLLRLLARINGDKKLTELFHTFETRHIIDKIQGTPFGDALEKHTHEYQWLGYGFIGPNWGVEYFADTLASLVRQGADGEQLLREAHVKRERLAEEQKRISTELGLSEKERQLFEVAKGFVYAKGYRKEALFKYCSRIEPLLVEIARRFHISLADVRFCYWDDMEQLLAGKMDLALLRARREFSLFESKENGSLFIEGEAARKHLAKLRFEEEEVKEVSILNGTCACAGMVRGLVRIINKPEEMAKMAKGDILVSIATYPELVPAMRKAGAIVTDMGGITCHAAIVSREFNIPCVVGTGKATKALHDGDLVEADATHGLVRVVERAKRN